MTITTKVAAVGLLALTIVGSAIAPAMALCANPRPAMSLTDTTTENQEALRRIEALGNRCVTSRATGERLSDEQVLQFLSTNPDDRDVDYNRIARQLNIQ
jgi:hypothetical protein